MNYQSVSIHVPTKGKCINNCKFCVSNMHNSPYENLYFKNSFYKNEFLKRLQFCKDKDIDTVILTGISEPLQNKAFLLEFSEMNKEVSFQWIELQTSGNMLIKKREDGSYDTSNLDFLQGIGVSTISLSISNLFDSSRNAQIIGMPERHQFDIDILCKEIKRYNFNLRLSLNISNEFDNYSVDDIFNRAVELNADQVTFRKLFVSSMFTDSKSRVCEQDIWVINNKCKTDFFNKHDHNSLYEYVKYNGKILGKLPYGAIKYSIKGLSTVIDDNCMDNSEDRINDDNYKYLILRPNCKLYTNWSEKSSLLF